MRQKIPPKDWCHVFLGVPQNRTQGLHIFPAVVLYQEQSGVRTWPEHAHSKGRAATYQLPGSGPGPTFGIEKRHCLYGKSNTGQHDDFKLWLCHEKRLQTVAYSFWRKKKWRNFLKWKKNGLSSCFYLQQVSTADWASPLVLVVAPPPWEPPQGCLLGEKHSAAVAVLLALSPAAQQL